MPHKLHVGNLSHLVEKNELERLFAVHGTVQSAEITNRLKAAHMKGTGLVELDSEKNCESAIAALNGMQHRGSALIVSWATPRQRKGVDAPQMFESMNIPDEGEDH